jgi:hypothetical protein
MMTEENANNNNRDNNGYTNKEDYQSGKMMSQTYSN